jgi:hypothetical protein
MNEALGAYQKAIQVGPHYWANYNELGKALQRVAELAPAISTGYANLAVVYFSQGKFKAIPYFKKGLARTFVLQANS